MKVNLLEIEKKNKTHTFIFWITKTSDKKKPISDSLNQIKNHKNWHKNNSKKPCNGSKNRMPKILNLANLKIIIHKDKIIIIYVVSKKQSILLILKEKILK